VATPQRAVNLGILFLPFNATVLTSWKHRSDQAARP
jgi:hypothetical protein